MITMKNNPYKHFVVMIGVTTIEDQNNYQRDSNLIQLVLDF